MVFNSLTFIIFTLVFFSVWPLMRGKKRRQWIFLVLASWVFYGWFNIWYVLLLVFISTLSYLAAIGMERYPAKKDFLFGVGLVENLGVLGVSGILCK